MKVEEKKIIIFAIKSTAFDDKVLIMAKDVNRRHRKV